MAKTTAPRSYDFKKTENKGYNERLRMPQFNFNEDEIEAVMTFVLGLVAEPPAPQYVASYRTIRGKGRSLPAPKWWSNSIAPAAISWISSVGTWRTNRANWARRSKPNDYRSSCRTSRQTQIDDSKKEDRRGRFRAQLYGRPLVRQRRTRHDRRKRRGRSV